MLTKVDLQAIKELIKDSQQGLEKKLAEKIDSSRQEVERKLTKKITEFKDQILGEIEDLREDNTIMTGFSDQLEDHELRLTKIEKITQLP